jgi:hypothetical protein
VWLVKHNFKKRIATVVAEYISDNANNTEKMGDIGEEYPEGIQSDVWTWLRSANPQPYQFHVEDLTAEQMDVMEYVEDDVKSVICFVLRIDTSIWGFVEVWETRTPRTFTAQEIEATQTIILKLEAILKTA